MYWHIEWEWVLGDISPKSLQFSWTRIESNDWNRILKAVRLGWQVDSSLGSH